MAQIYKIWSSNRVKKVLIAAENSPQLYVDIILKASNKMDIDGSKLVLEEDGTEVDEETISLINSSTPLILLSKDEVWKANESISTNSTVTVHSLSDISEDTSSSIDTPSKNVYAYCQDFTNERSFLSEAFWLEYSIPFENLSKGQLEELNKGCKHKALKNSVIDFVIKEIRKNRECIPSKCLKIISKKIVDRFPNTFKDTDEDGVTLGDGLHSTYCKLIDHNNYLNRPHKRASDSISPNNVKQRKLLLSAKAGCLNWEPVLTDGDLNSVELIKKELQLIVGQSDDSREKQKENIFQQLEATYSAQRLFINQTRPSVQKILEEWPILFIQEYLYWHYNKLMGHQIDSLGENFEMKKAKLLEFGIKNKLCTTETTYDTDSASIKALGIIAKYFNDNMEFLLIHMEETAQLTDVETKSSSPCIVNFGKQYFLFIEERNVNNGSANFMSSMQELFAAYYVFNMAYPKEISATLEFIQRYFLKLHPDAGSKSKRGTATKYKVLKLINKLLQQ